MSPGFIPLPQVAATNREVWVTSVGVGPFVPGIPSLVPSMRTLTVDWKSPEMTVRVALLTGPKLQSASIIQACAAFFSS
jgi:hypothetical protein